jgi:hypothetical protein
MVKKMLKICCVLMHVHLANAMMPSWVERHAKKTAECFGDVDYFVSAMHAVGISEEQLIRVQKILNNPRYRIVCVTVGDHVRVQLYKHASAEGYELVGLSVFSKKGPPFELGLVRVNTVERGHGLGSLLFMYAVHVMRQYTSAARICKIVWQAFPLSPGGLQQEELNRFYEKLGGKITDEKLNFFEWCGPSLRRFKSVHAVAPFKLYESKS